MLFVLLVQLVLPVLQVMLVQGKLHRVIIFIAEADADYLGLADGIEAVSREFGKKLVGVLEGCFVVVKGDGVAGRRLPDAGLHVEDIVITNQEQSRFQLAAVKAVVKYGEVGSGNDALFVNVGFEVNIAIGGEIVGAAVVKHIGVAVAKAAEQYQKDAKEDYELIFHVTFLSGFDFIFTFHTFC